MTELKTYTVKVYPMPYEYKIEAENEQEAEDKAINRYSYDGDGIYKIIAKED